MTTTFEANETLFNAQNFYVAGKMDGSAEAFDATENKLRSEDARMVKTRHKSALKHLPELRTTALLRNENLLKHPCTTGGNGLLSTIAFLLVAVLFMGWFFWRLSA